MERKPALDVVGDPIAGVLHMELRLKILVYVLHLSTVVGDRIRAQIEDDT